MLLMCPHCGWLYSPEQYAVPGDDGRSYALVPSHALASVADADKDLKNAAANFGECPGSEQCPRNPESDRRPLWKDLKDESAR